MKEFTFLFQSPANNGFQPSPQQMQDSMKQWQDWLGGIAAQGKLASMGNRLGSEATTVAPNNIVTNGPYAETKEVIGGYIVVKAEDIQAAAEIAKGCPVLQAGGRVDIRNVIPMDTI